MRTRILYEKPAAPINAEDEIIRAYGGWGRVSYDPVTTEPNDLPPIGVEFGSSIRHTIIHSILNGGVWANTKDTVAHKFLMYDVGWKDASPNSPRLHQFGGNGINLYCQNDGTNQKRFEFGVIMGSMASIAVKVYTTNTDNMKRFAFIDTIIHGGEFLIGGEKWLADDIIVDHCAIAGYASFGYRPAGNGRAELTNSLITGGLRVRTYNETAPAWQSFKMTGNTVIDRTGFGLIDINTNLIGNYEIDRNVYYTDNPAPFGGLTWNQWRAKGFDANSPAPQPLSQAPIQVWITRPNPSYAPNLFILAPQGQPQVTADLSGHGHVYWHSAQAVFNDVRESFDGTMLVEMNGPLTPVAGWDYQSGIVLPYIHNMFNDNIAIFWGEGERLMPTGPELDALSLRIESLALTPAQVQSLLDAWTLRDPLLQNTAEFTDLIDNMTGSNITTDDMENLISMLISNGMTVDFAINLITKLQENNITPEKANALITLMAARRQKIAERDELLRQARIATAEIDQIDRQTYSD